MTDFYMGSLNFLTKKRNNIAQSVKDLKKNDTLVDDYKMATKEYVHYLNTILNVLEHAEIFDLRELNDISDNIKDVNYQGNLLSNIEEIRMPYSKCYFEMEGLPHFAYSDSYSRTSGFLVWETSYKEIREILENWMSYDADSVNKIGLVNQEAFIDSDRVLFVLGISKALDEASLGEAYLFGGAGALLLNATRPVIHASTISHTEESLECLKIDKHIKLLVELCLLTLRPHEFDEFTINAEMDEDIEITYNSMYVDIGFNSEKFRHIFDQGLEEEVNDALEKESIENLSPKAQLYFSVFSCFSCLKDKELSSNSLKREILKVCPSLSDHELMFIHDTIKSSLDADRIADDMKKMIDSAFMFNAIKIDLNLPKIFIQFFSYMLQHQKIEVVGKYSKSFLNKSNLPKRAAKRRLRSIVIKDTKKEITSSFVSSGLGSSKAPHKRRGHKRTYQSGVSIWVKECDINAHKGKIERKQSYKVSMA